MRSIAVWLVLVLCVLVTAQASPVPLGFISYDVVWTGELAAFDIVSMTGENSADPDFPVATSVQLANLRLDVSFTDGSSRVFSNFQLSLDGISFDGQDYIALGGVAPALPTTAKLTGTVINTSVTLTSGASHTLASSFTATVPYNPAGLQDGDFALIYA